MQQQTLALSIVETKPGGTTPRATTRRRARRQAATTEEPARELVPPVYRIALVREPSAPYGTGERPKIVRQRDAEAILRPHFEGADREMVIVATLDTKNQAIGVNVVSTGTINHALMFPREVLKLAILQNATAIVIAHNHPSGDPGPSRDDLASTKRLIEAARILGISVLDHIIIGDRTYWSLSESNPELWRT